MQTLDKSVSADIGVCAESETFWEPHPKTIKVHVGSEDRKVHEACREVLGELLGPSFTVVDACDADLYIWDVDDGNRDFPRLRSSETWRHFFLVNREHVETKRENLPFADARIILKPVSNGTLKAFLAEACKRSIDTQHADEIDSLRADRDEILQCLMETNLKLQEYDHDRTNFLARAIHEFRAPLTAITGYCGLLLTENPGALAFQQRELLERMHRSSKKLSRMVTAMFQLSIAPRFEISLSLEPGEIKDTVEQALNEIAFIAEEKRINIDVDLAPSPEPLVFEFEKIEQVVVNLLFNACKFVPRAGSIQIKGYPYFWERRTSGLSSVFTVPDRRIRNERKPNAYRLDIEDSGPGVPPAHLATIFEEYTTYAGGADRSGGGLGLAICRLIIHQHSGRIWAESSTRQGAMFSFVLPLKRQETASRRTSSNGAVSG